jgi:hypothetical protein
MRNSEHPVMEGIGKRPVKSELIRMILIYTRLTKGGDVGIDGTPSSSKMCSGWTSGGYISKKSYDSLMQSALI